jgi:hypothetical protein
MPEGYTPVAICPHGHRRPDPSINPLSFFDLSDSDPGDVAAAGAEIELGYNCPYCGEDATFTISDLYVRKGEGGSVSFEAVLSSVLDSDDSIETAKRVSKELLELAEQNPSEEDLISANVSSKTREVLESISWKDAIQIVGVLVTVAKLIISVVPHESGMRINFNDEVDVDVKVEMRSGGIEKESDREEDVGDREYRQPPDLKDLRVLPGMKDEPVINSIKSVFDTDGTLKKLDDNSLSFIMKLWVGLKRHHPGSEFMLKVSSTKPDRIEVFIESPRPAFETLVRHRVFIESFWMQSSKMDRRSVSLHLDPLTDHTD